MMSPSASPLWNTNGVSPTRSLVAEATTFLTYILPPLFCYFIMAVLVITPKTRAIRIALCPVMVLLALRAALPVDISLRVVERKFHNDFAIWMFVITTRSLGWALAEQPLVRRIRPADSTPSTVMDALDLTLNFRGCGWDWSRGVYIPRETRPSNRTGFVFHTALSVAIHGCIFGILNTAIRTFTPAGKAFLSQGHVLHESLPFSHKGLKIFIPLSVSISPGSIFDTSLPLPLRFLRSSVITFLASVCTYTALHAYYDICTLISVLIFDQDPAQWPPSFDAPWRATSLTNFWGRRWHQWFRHLFLTQAGYPLSLLLGRAGIVIGAFLASAVHHHIVLVSLDSKSALWRMLIGFGMMAPGIILEHLFTFALGRKVRGMAGWLWTMGWLLVWGTVMMDGFTRAGFFGSATWVDVVPPVRVCVERLVTEFDALLHAVTAVAHVPVV